MFRLLPGHADIVLLLPHFASPFTLPLIFTPRRGVTPFAMSLASRLRYHVAVIFARLPLLDIFITLRDVNDAVDAL